MKRRAHRAVVMELDFVDSDDESTCYVAMCLRTHRMCDAYAWTDIAPDETEFSAMERACEYLGMPEIHDKCSSRFCDADHVLA